MNLQKRERILLIVTLAIVLLYFGGSKVKGIVFGPVIEARERLESLRDQARQKSKSFDQITTAARDLQELRSRSLPGNPFDAHRLYQAWITEMGEAAGLREMKVTPGSVGTGQVYATVPVTITAKANFQSLAKFLYRFERTDLAHRIISLSVRPKTNTGDPEFDLSLIAEGLAFVDAPHRSTLFPETTLQADFTSSREKQTIEIADPAGFPDTPGFRIHIGNEVLTVQRVSQNRWDVVGGQDNTSPAPHKAGDTVRLELVHPNYVSRPLESIPALAQASLFVKPTPKSESQPGSAPGEDPAADTHLSMFYVFENDKPRATLIDTKRATKTDLTEGTEFKIGDIQATVVEIHRTHIILKNSEGLWRLDFGDTLRKMAKVDAPSG